MKKNTGIILAIVALMLTVVGFTACQRDNKPADKVVTVTDEAGNVYEEVTEIHSELVTELHSEVVTEVVTEIVSNADSPTTSVVNKVVTSLKTEVVSEVVSEVVTQTVPYVPTSSSGNKVTTTRSSHSKATTTASPLTSTNASGGNAVTSTSPSGSGGSGGSGGGGASGYIENVTYVDGSKINVELDANGNPKNSYLKQALGTIANGDSIYLNATYVSGSIAGIVETGNTIKMWMKGDKYALETNVGALKMRIIQNEKGMYITLSSGYYYQLDTGSGSSGVGNVGDLADMFDDAEKTYIDTTKVKVNGTNYICEKYSIDGATVKYFFDSSNGQLKRIETTSDAGENTIIKINSYSATVNDSEFVVPSKYTQLTDDQLEKIFGSLM